MYQCSMGFEAEREQVAMSEQECTCSASCEPHIHESSTYILCLHDGETDHGHCPNATFLGTA
jgi:hypothetical protein